MEISPFSKSKCQSSRYFSLEYKRSSNSTLSYYKQSTTQSVKTRDFQSSCKVSKIFRITSPVVQSLARSTSEHPGSTLHTPSRRSYKFALPKQPISDLKQRQKEISDFLSSINKSRKHSTARLLLNKSKTIQTSTLRRDSFRNKYDPTKNIFTHELIGQVPLPRKIFSFVRPESELEILKQVSTIYPYNEKEIKFEAPVIDLFKKHTVNDIEDLKKRARTALKHMIRIQIDPLFLPKLNVLIPKQPFGLPKSHKFIHACKEGNLTDVKILLAENPWLAHTFDSSKQSGLHWAAKRNFCGVMRALIEAGTWVDSRDLVGRSALFIATRTGFLDGVKLLLELYADPFLKTYAGSSISSVASNMKVKLLIVRAKLVISILETLPQEVRSVK